VQTTTTWVIPQVHTGTENMLLFGSVESQ